MKRSVSKPARLVLLDAMRGIAALAVLIGHFGELTHTWQPSLFYIAVDLFFVLSGFVLARVYDAEFEAGLTSMAFMHRRVIRLLPLAVLSSRLALAARLESQPPSSGPVGAEIMSACAMALAIPMPPIPGTPSLLFPLNSAIWSLFLEFWVANLLFAFGWRYIRGARLMAVVSASALALLICERFFHSINIGWSWTNVLGGFARLLFSFFIGVVIARGGPRWPKLGAPPTIILPLLAGMLLTPVTGQSAQLVSLGYILLGFPLLVALASTRPHANGRLGVLLGDVSYAVYVIHIPCIVLSMRFCGPALLAFLRHEPAALAAIEGTFVIGIVSAAWLIDRTYDRPLRAGLSRSLANRSSAHLA